jgi:cell division initiation protein
MAHKIKALEKQLEEAQKDDNAMLETLETAKKLMADISASAERRAELMMRDAELEAENMLLDAKVSVRKLNDEHTVLSNKIRRLRGNFRKMLEAELARLEEDDFDLMEDLEGADTSSSDALDKMIIADAGEPAADRKAPTLVVPKADLAGVVASDSKAGPTDLEHATISDLSDSLKKMAEEPASISDTIILK